MESLVLSFVLTSLLHGGTSSFTELSISSNYYNWEDAKKYCEANNGRLLELDSQEKWNFFISTDEYTNLGTEGYWTGLRLDDTIECDTTRKYIPWLYNGWGRWLSTYSEPNRCRGERCVRLQDSWMHTSPCDESKKAICEIAADTSSRVATTPQSESTDVSSTTPNTPSTELSTASTTPTVTTDTSSTTQRDPDTYTSTVETSTDVIQDTSSTTSNNQDADLSTASTTPAASTDDASSTTQRNPDAYMSTVETTTSPTAETDATHDGQSTTPNIPVVDGQSTAPNTISTVKQAGVGSTLSTSTARIHSTVKNESCNKCCTRSTNSRNLNQQELEEIIKALKIELAVNKPNLSIQKRKLISVYESRPSSVAMGGVACVVLVVFVGVIVVPDIITFARYVFKQF